MASSLNSTQPLWIEGVKGSIHSPLSPGMAVDVAIVGGGITGLTTALSLQKAGKSVAILELHQIGRGESGHTTAHLTEVLDISFQQLITQLGIEKAQLVCESHRQAIQHIEDNIDSYGIECGFRRVAGYKYSESDQDLEFMENESRAAWQIGLANTVTKEIPLPFSVPIGIRFDHQAKFHPWLYMEGLARQLTQKGGLIFENTRVLGLKEGSPCLVQTDHGTITATDVVIAANVPVINKFFLHTKLAAYRTYVLALKLRSDEDWDTENLFWDNADPYHYIRSHTMAGTRYLIVGGKDHKTGQRQDTQEIFRELEIYCKERLDYTEVTHRWSGQIIEPVDHLPYIGRNSLSEHIFVATGYSGNGMTFGTIAGRLISDLILEEPNPWAEIYDATRVKPLASAKEFLLENIDYPSHLIADRLKFEKIDLNEIPENTGRIVRLEGKKVAVYKDSESRLHLLSPVCPHLGCYVGWNEAEKSWDCPCHGSRFSATGHLLNGPAVKDLTDLTIDGDSLPPWLVSSLNDRLADNPPLVP